MKILKLILSIGLLLSMTASSRAQEGEQLFRSNCASCHSIGKGKLVGPDLQDIHTKRDEQWLHKWVKSSQSLVKEGDAVAVQVFNENNKVPMPDAFISDDQIKTVLAYVKTKSTENASASASSTQQASDANSIQTDLPPDVKKSAFSLSNFSSAEYILLSLCVLLIIIVWLMSKTIRSLSTELGHKYNSDDYL